MKKILTITVALISSFAWGERFQDNIQSIDQGAKGQEHILLLQSGRVAFLNPKTILSITPKDLNYNDRVELEIDQNLTIKSIKIIKNHMPTPLFLLDDRAQEEQEEPTILPNYSSAKSIFNLMNRTYKNKSECTDRAHVWSYEEWLKNELKTQKVFLFFTNTYIRQYRYRWWFHTSPYAFVNENGTIIERVLDRRFTNYPHKMKPWTDIFIRSRKECPISTYTNYRNNRYGPEHCYVVKTTMYYRLPLHVERMEKYGITKDSFNMSEVNFSYRAFNTRYTPPLD